VLESIELPDGQHTSIQAIERMTERLARERESERRRAASLPSSPALQRETQRAHRLSVKTLKRMGIA